MHQATQAVHAEIGDKQCVKELLKELNLLNDAYVGVRHFDSHKLDVLSRKVEAWISHGADGLEELDVQCGVNMNEANGGTGNLDVNNDIDEKSGLGEESGIDKSDTDKKKGLDVDNGIGVKSKLDVNGLDEKDGFDKDIGHVNGTGKENGVDDKCGIHEKGSDKNLEYEKHENEKHDINEVTKDECKNGDQENAGSLDRWARVVGGQRKLTRGLSVILYKLQDMAGTHCD